MPPNTWVRKVRNAFREDGLLRPFRLLRQDLHNLPKRWVSDWAIFNQLVVASAVYVFFTNLLPGITFASDLIVLTGKNWGTIEVVLSTGLCGIIFSLLAIQPLTILGVTGPFSILAENIYSLCVTSFHVCLASPAHRTQCVVEHFPDRVFAIHGMGADSCGLDAFSVGRIQRP